MPFLLSHFLSVSFQFSVCSVLFRLLLFVAKNIQNGMFALTIAMSVFVTYERFKYTYIAICHYYPLF